MARKPGRPRKLPLKRQKTVFGGNFTIEEIDERRSKRLARSRQVLQAHARRHNARVEAHVERQVKFGRPMR